MNEQAFYQETNQRTLRGPYLLYGVEELTKQQAVDRVLALLDPGFSDMNLHRLQAPDLAALLGAVDQLPFFDAFHLVLVIDWSDKDLSDAFDALEKKQKGAIDGFFSVTDAVVLFVRRGAPKETAFSKMFASRGRSVEFPALTPDRAAKFCMREAALLGVQLGDRSARLLIEMVGTDAYRLRNELSKAAGFVGKGEAVTADTLQTVVTPSSEYNAFKLLNALLSGDKKTGLRMLETELNAGKENALGVAGFLEGRLKAMLIAREMLDRKRPRQEIITRIGGSPYAAGIAIDNAKKCSARQLRDAVAAFAEVNMLVKTGQRTDRAALFDAIYRNF